MAWLFVFLVDEVYALANHWLPPNFSLIDWGPTILGEPDGVVLELCVRLDAPVRRAVNFDLIFFHNDNL